MKIRHRRVVALGIALTLLSGCTNKKKEEEINYDIDTILMCMETLGNMRYVGINNIDTNELQDMLDEDTYNNIIEAMGDKGQPYVDLTKYVVARAQDVEAMIDTNQNSTIPSEFDPSEMLEQIEEDDAKRKAREESSEESLEDKDVDHIGDKYDTSMNIQPRDSHIVTSGNMAQFMEMEEPTKIDGYKFNKSSTTSELGITDEDTEKYGGAVRSNEHWDSIIGDYITLDYKITFLKDTEQYVVLTSDIDTDAIENTVMIDGDNFVFSGKRIKLGMDSLIGNTDYSYEVIGYTLCDDGYLITNYTNIANGFNIYGYVDKNGKIHIDDIAELVSKE